MKSEDSSSNKVKKPAYFANWADLWAFPLTYKFVPIVSKISFLTPNVITTIAFSSYTFGSISLFLNYPNHLIFGGILILLGFLGDDLDGQIARARKLSSPIGDYLDKTLDVLKIYIITISLSYAVYLQTQNILSIFLGFTACFFFNYRYYIKLETMFSSIDRSPNYLKLSAEKRSSLEENLNNLHNKLWQTPFGKLKSMWLKNRIIFFVDEAEFAVFTFIGTIFNKLELTLWVLAISQVLIAIFRFYERISQINSHSPKLLEPLRK